MDDVVTVHRLQRVNQARTEEFSLLLRESSVPGQVVSQVAAEEQVHDQVKVLGVLECVVSVNDELRINHGEQLQLIHH